jgi:hypothetical protein
MFNSGIDMTLISLLTKWPVEKIEKLKQTLINGKRAANQEAKKND